MGACNQKLKFEGNDHIPENILTDVLKRLSVKPLSRFRCVCKGWNDLIKSPFFINLHLNYQKRNPSKEDYILMASRYMSRSIEGRYAAISFYSGELLPIDSPAGFPDFPHCRLDICAPCNGIICFVADINVRWDYDDDDDSGEGAIYLCNPATQECRTLPPRSFVPRFDKVARVACGFGVDPRTNAYKVVSVMFHYKDIYMYDDRDYSGQGIYQIEIFDLGSNSWREVETVLPQGFAETDPVFSRDWNGTGVLFNGSLHWMFGDYILGFDLSSEVLLNLGKHEKCKNEVSGQRQWHLKTLMVVDDSLAIVDATGPSNYYPICVISVFVMEKYGDEESWVERYYLGPMKTSLMNPLTAIPNHGILLSKSDETLVSFDLSPDGYEDDDIEVAGYQLTGEILSNAKLFYSTIVRAVVVSEQTLVSVK